MGFDQGLAERVRAQLAGIPGLTERRMFGGLSFLVDGNLCVGVLGDELMARVGPAATEAALARPGSRLFDMGGRPMKGWVNVRSEVLEADDVLAGWVADALAFVRTLPPK
jgi:TfoX/Sxy family transcriptional regulator of competence genes